jgi:5-hydroxyisourate hydrolase
MPGISIHVVDVTRGAPARGMRVDVYRIDDGVGRHLVANGEVGPEGIVAHPMTTGAGVVGGGYQVELAVGAYYRGLDADVGAPAFQETAVFRFTVVDPTEHYHLPIKLSPWGLSIWRGR